MIKTNDIFFIVLALIIFALGLRKRFANWGIGTRENRTDLMFGRVKNFLAEGIFHGRILQDAFPGIMHLFIFLGFMIPLFVIVITQFDFTLPLYLSRPLSLFLDLIALAALIGVLMAFYRRIISRPDRLDNRLEDFTVLLIIFLMFSTGLFMEALRLSIIGDDGRSWAPVGKALAGLITFLGWEVKTRSMLAFVTFRIHFFLVLGAIALIPFSKLFHVVSSPLNMIFRSLRPRGELKLLDLEDEQAETFGISKIQEFTWKQLMDLDACTRCGRCQDNCPAFLTGKPLSPKKFINDLEDHLLQRGPVISKARQKGDETGEVPGLVGSVVGEDEVWACTTCRSCMEHCPVYIEHVDKIMDLRRYKVLMEGRFPEELKVAFKGLETNSNPWGIGQSTRCDWAREMEVPCLPEMEDRNIDLLFFVGCLRSYDDRNKNVAQAMARILKHQGVKFAVLGTEEGCCGDPARRAGNEYLYQMLAQTNIEVFNRYNIKKILTTCPHCYNTLKVEYAQLGFEAEVIHHSQYLMEQIRNNRLSPPHTINKKITYHDPCYLGRYSGIYESPRQVLRSLKGLEFREMGRSRRDSLCCGAGGSWMWLDEKIGERINHYRLKDVLKVDSEWVSTACPFCVIMFTDAVKDNELEDRLKVWDIAEIVEMGLFGEK